MDLGFWWQARSTAGEVSVKSLLHYILVSDARIASPCTDACAGIGVALHSSHYRSKSVHMLKLGFLNRFVIASAARLPRRQIRNSTDIHFKWKVVVITVSVIGFFLVAVFLSGEVATFPKVVLFWVIILGVILRNVKDVNLYIILEVQCFVFTDYHLLMYKVWYLLIFLMLLWKQCRYTSRRFF